MIYFQVQEGFIKFSTALEQTLLHFKINQLLH